MTFTPERIAQLRARTFDPDLLAVLDEIERLYAELSRVKAERDEAVKVFRWITENAPHIGNVVAASNYFLSRMEGK